MNKDVIYIEPEDDITDILVNIKGAKHKIIALVPPKKAGVLHSAVNFKLIAKTAINNEKTVVLITSDESLLRLAEKVKMPTAKTLQSKPHLPEMDDAEEFGEEDDTEEEDKEEKEEEKPAEDDVAEEPSEESEKEESKKEEKKPVKKAAVAAGAKKKSDIDMEIDGKDDDEADEKNTKKSSKKKIHIPNFKKFRWPLLIGVVLIAALVALGYWMSNVAPAAKITVKVKTTAANFNETVSFVTDQTKSDPEKGIFFAEQKTVTKQATDDFEATGEVDKGTKATGSITVKVKSPITIASGAKEASFTVPAGTVFTNTAGNKYISSAAVTLAVKKEAIDFTSCKRSADGNTDSCNLKSEVSGTVQVVAENTGESYNFAASTSGWTFPIASVTAVKASDMTGGTSKIVKVVSTEDIDRAALNISNDIDSEAREELSRQFSSDYILISSSFATESTKITTSPVANEEVGEGVTPKIIKENKYIIYAVNKAEVDSYIRAVVSSKIGDDTQMVYSTGVDMNGNEENKSFFEGFKADAMVAKLKSTSKTGPRVTEEQVMRDVLGKKVGVANSKLKFTKGIQEVDITTSYFFVTTIPEDENKVEIKITVDD